MSLAPWLTRYGRAFLFLFVSLAIAGALVTTRVPVSLFPRVTFPRVMLVLEAGDRTAERLAIVVTRPIEEAVRRVPGVRGVRSWTSRGAAELSVQFVWGRDMIEAELLLEAAVARVAPELPADTTHEIARMEPTVFPVLGYTLTSPTRSLVELRDLALYRVRPALSTIAGVADIAVLGGRDAEYQVRVDPDRLDALDLTPNDVVDALQRANILEAAGRTEDLGQLFLVVTNAELHDAAEIGHVAVRADPSGLVRVSDVATVVQGTAPQWTVVSAEGADAVIFQVFQQPDGNTVQIAQDAERILADLRNVLPDDVAINNWYDQSDLIVASAVSVRDAIAIGIGLAALTVLLFLGDWRSTIIAALTVGLVLAASILVLWGLGMSFNVMTLGGLAAAVGLVIDDAIVVLEHVVRRLDDPTRHQAVTEAAAEFTRPLLGSSLATVVIFSPLAFMTGVTGSFFQALSITMASALGVSFLVSWLAVPTLSGLVGLHRRRRAAKHGPGHGRTARAYAAVMERMLRVPLLAFLLFAGPLVGAGYVAWTQLGSGFMPSLDEGGFVLDYHSVWGTSLSETDRMLREVEAILQDTPEVDTYSRRTGLELGGGLTESNEGDFFVRLKGQPRRGLDEVMDEVRGRVEERVPGLEIEMALLMEDLLGDLVGVPQPIEVKLYSDDAEELSRLAETVAAALEAIPGVVDVEDGQIVAGNALELHVDAEEAARDGLTVEDISDTVAAYVDGRVATSVQDGPKMVGIRVVMPGAQTARAASLGRLRVRGADGQLVPVGRVAHWERVLGQPQIAHEDASRMTAVTARISGRDLGSVIEDVTRLLDGPDVLPSHVHYQLGGLYAQQQEAFRNMAAVIGASAALLFLLLLLLYQRFGVALAAMLAALLSIPAVLIGLWVTGTELNITSLMGLTMIAGIASEVSVFYVSEVHELHALSGRPRLIEAGLTRVRPVAMMNAAAVLSLLPLALGLGEGADMLTPLAIAIISGLLVQLPVAVFVLPCLLELLGGSFHGVSAES